MDNEASGLHVPEVFSAVAPRRRTVVVTTVPGFIELEPPEGSRPRRIEGAMPRIHRWRSLSTKDLVGFKRVDVLPRGAIMIPPTTIGRRNGWIRERMWVRQGSGFTVDGREGTLIALKPPSGVRTRGWSGVQQLLAGLEMFVPDPSQLKPR